MFLPLKNHGHGAHNTEIPTPDLAATPVRVRSTLTNQGRNSDRLEPRAQPEARRMGPVRIGNLHSAVQAMTNDRRGTLRVWRHILQ